MGYFSNGMEGLCYEATYCDKCVHQEAGCAVWLAHLVANYDECNKADSVLHVLIPRDADGNNGKCAMFLEPTAAIQSATGA
jgi:hypothetical protein